MSAVASGPAIIQPHYQAWQVSVEHSYTTSAREPLESLPSVWRAACSYACPLQAHPPLASRLGKVIWMHFYPSCGLYGGADERRAKRAAWAWASVPSGSSVQFLTHTTSSVSSSSSWKVNPLCRWPWQCALASQILRGSRSAFVCAHPSRMAGATLA